MILWYSLREAGQALRDPAGMGVEKGLSAGDGGSGRQRQHDFAGRARDPQSHAARGVTAAHGDLHGLAINLDVQKVRLRRGEGSQESAQSQHGRNVPIPISPVTLAERRSSPA